MRRHPLPWTAPVALAFLIGTIFAVPSAAQTCTPASCGAPARLASTHVTRPPAQFFASHGITPEMVDHGVVHGGGMGCEIVCDPCAPCPPMYGYMLWAELDFLLWWRSGRYFPALATTPGPGVLPGARVLFGDGELTEQARPGGRVNFGMWLEPCQTVGIGGSFLTLGNARASFFADQNQYPNFLAVPFWDTSQPPGSEPNSFPVVNPAVPSIGSISIESNSDFLAADAFMRTLWLQGPVTRVDFIFGYQLARIDEDLLLDTRTEVQPRGPIIATSDAFLVQNEFHGGHFGLKGQYRWGDLSLDLSAKIGFGNMSQRAQLTGLYRENDIIDPARGGFLVHPSNAGEFKRDEFSYMHDVGISLSYYPVERLKLSFGYSMMFFSDVMRPGELIDTHGRQPAVDSRQFDTPPAGTRPIFRFDSTHYYVHGLNAGLEYRF